MSRVATIPEALLATAERGEGEYVFHLEEGPVRLSCAELAERARRAALRLVALGVEPGDAVGLLGPNRPEWVVWAFATWLAGGVLVPIQKKVRIRDPAGFGEQLSRLVGVAGCRLVLCDRDLAGLAPSGVGVPWEELEGSASAEEPAPAQPGSPAVIQFSSGSTAVPKGALLSHAAVIAQMEVLRAAYRHPDGAPRTVVNWAPFFHDLGLFANLVHPAYAGAVIHQLPTERFARDPAEWLRLAGTTRATITVAPSSAFGSALRAASRRKEGIDLGALEAALFATEGVDPEVAARVLEMAPALGLRTEALGSTYGLAEAVMAVAYSSIGAGLRLDRISLRQLASSGVAAPAGEEPARALASCGPPRTDVRIAGPNGPQPERGVGEIQARGPSSMSRYVGEAPPDPFADGWLRTGDLGYLADGELFVTGRAKDMMIAMGHNYYPEDFEWAAGRVEGVRPGRCVAFSEPNAGGDGIVVLVEPGGNGDCRALERRVGNAIADAIGVAPSDVLAVPAGTVEKTTSGKLRRAAMRELYARGELERR